MAQASLLAAHLFLTAILSISFLSLGGSAHGEEASSQAPLSTPIGMSARLDDVVLPGSELEVIPLEDRSSPIVLRIVRSFPHGTDRRYDLEFYGLEPGTYDLGEYLRRKDRSELGALPPIPVVVVETLPADRIEPHALTPSGSPRVGGYTWLLIAGAGVWLLGLVVLFLLPRKKRTSIAGDDVRPKSLAERLRPLIDRAAKGEARHDELAALERNLLAYWRRRLRLDNATTGEAIAKLRAHPEAGGLMRSLERWLHAGPTKNDVDVDALLAPYRDVSEREFDPATADARSPGRAPDLATPAEA